MVNKCLHLSYFGFLLCYLFVISFINSLSFLSFFNPLPVVANWFSLGWLGVLKNAIFLPFILSPFKLVSNFANLSRYLPYIITTGFRLNSVQYFSSYNYNLCCNLTDCCLFKSYHLISWFMLCWCVCFVDQV